DLTRRPAVVVQESGQARSVVAGRVSGLHRRVSPLVSGGVAGSAGLPWGGLAATGGTSGGRRATELGGRGRCSRCAGRTAWYAGRRLPGRRARRPCRA